MASIAMLIFAFILTMDFFLPKTQHEVEVIGYNVSPGGTIQMELNDGSVINISKKAMRKMKSSSLTIARTKFFDVPYQMTDKENNSAYIEISIYGNFIFMPLALLATALVGTTYKERSRIPFQSWRGQYRSRLAEHRFSSRS